MKLFKGLRPWFGTYLEEKFVFTIHETYISYELGKACGILKANWPGLITSSWSQ